MIWYLRICMYVTGHFYLWAKQIAHSFHDCCRFGIASIVDFDKSTRFNKWLRLNKQTNKKKRRKTNLQCHTHSLRSTEDKHNFELQTNRWFCFCKQWKKSMHFLSYFFWVASSCIAQHSLTKSYAGRNSCCSPTVMPSILVFLPLVVN